jgi:putative DNA methylase
MAREPRVLIEQWFPVTELGIESRREAAPIPGQFPKLKTLHVWWARRPLAASAGAVVTSLLPAWSHGLAATFQEAPELQSQAAYREWVLKLCGVLGDPIAAKKRIALADAAGTKLGAKAYGYKPAFKNSPDARTLDLLHRVLDVVWGNVNVCDPTAGGGSIPFEALRRGLSVAANDLNPVAAGILQATLDAPARFGPGLSNDLQRWGSLLVRRTEDRLRPFFKLPDESSDNNSYLFARTIACPRTGKPVPLSPNWWLSKGTAPTAVRLMTERGGQQLEECEFEIVQGNAIDFDADRGTVAGGHAISPWDGLPIDGDHVKSEAQAKRMGSQLYAVAIRTTQGRGFRAPTAVDLDALAAAEAELARVLPKWLADDVVPNEMIDSVSNYNRGHRLYGMQRWIDMFSPRQLLVHGTCVEELRKLVPAVQAELDADRAAAVVTLLGIAQAKALNWNAISSSWDTGRDKIRSVFDSHNFAFKWAFAEFEGARELMPWCLEQTVDAYTSIAELLLPSDDRSLDHDAGASRRGEVNVSCANAADLAHLDDRSVTLVCIDPPYYDNVMYAELADFFYMWQKRTIGLVRPELFADDVCDKRNEAIANPARFAEFGKRRKELATRDYEAKMRAIFAEAARVLREDGVLTVMFTHKKAEAWDTLGMALMEAGFTIETSWPVQTESEQSLHQAKKNAASSTILLVCRRREPRDDDTHPYFEDVEGDVRAAARDALQRFGAAGIEGVDLLLSTYGPALSVISAVWPVFSSEADEATGRSRLLRPEEALDAARAEVVSLRRRRLVGAPTTLDPLTDFALIAWDTFRAAEFPYDEARRLALAVGGLDVDELVRAKLLAKRSGSVVLQEPSKRVRRGDDDALPGVRPGATSFAVIIDAVHTAMYVADHDGLPAAKTLLDRAGVSADVGFLAALQGLVNAIPRTRSTGEWVRPEAGTLDRLVTAYFPTIALPRDPDVVAEGEQTELALDEA